MDQFDAAVQKYGEAGAQALLENWERFSGVHHAFPLSLEQRWGHFIAATELFAAVA